MKSQCTNNADTKQWMGHTNQDDVYTILVPFMAQFAEFIIAWEAGLFDLARPDT